MRVKLLPKERPTCEALPRFAWHPVFVGRDLVWWEHIYRTRWHSPMGYWYWEYSYAG